MTQRFLLHVDLLKADGPPSRYCQFKRLNLKTIHLIIYFLFNYRTVFIEKKKTGLSVYLI